MDLELVLTEDLLDELKRRHDHMIFAGIQLGTGNNRDDEHRSWKGHSMWCQALALQVIRGLQDWEREPEKAED